jgi:SAM-dependent methyltransferase
VLYTCGFLVTYLRLDAESFLLALGLSETLMNQVATMPVLSTLVHKLRQRTLKQKLFTVANLLHKPAYRLQSRHFDFGGYIPANDLSDSATSANATAYQGFSPYYLKLLIREALATGRTFENFIDIGSGKGKVCLYAARFYPFHRVIGVEFSRRLVDTANANLEKSGAVNVEFVHADATQWQLPDGNSIVFLFNPFDATVMRHFLDFNRQHFRAHDSVLVYANAVHRDTVQECGFRSIVASRVFNCFLFTATAPGVK